MTFADVTVITASIPGRGRMLLEAVESVFAQTVAPHAHLVRCADPGVRDRAGKEAHICEQHNALLDAVATEWLAILNDDDVFLSHHLETIVPQLDGADVVYSWSTEPRVSRSNVNGWPAGQLLAAIGESNVLPYCAAIRTAALREVGGWACAERPYSDWDVWLRLARAGARFRCVPEPTWTYRFHSGQTCG